ncbi:MAG: thioredoxin domain-containing protein [Nitrospiria bacterium]
MKSKASLNPNKLINETSPYLLQHAYNPVDWHPWGEAAFEKARQEGKPVLLSIGYSACHWCHVMAHESFENDKIAAVMNAHFVNIKVDREERPDLDQVYQTVVQFFIKRGGGWPLTLFLTPDKIPFYGGTYFPPEDRYQLTGFPKLLGILSETYRSKRDDVSKTVQDVQNALDQLREHQADRPIRSVDPDLLEKSVQSLRGLYDPANGGFGAAPKFPSTPALDLFLRYFQQSGATEYLQMVRYTLRRMAWGGIYDQLGGGFHRYSVDEAWRVPHFEKMLYDNAQLSGLYFSVYQASADEYYKTIACEILDYVLREMTSPEGGFYASQDADTEGGEGLYYLWTPRQVKDILGDWDGTLFCRYYNISEAGNFEGKNILHLTRPLDRVAEEMGRDASEALRSIQAAKKRLLSDREKRPRPFRDEKSITAWSSLMISAFVTGYQVTRNQDYLSVAVQGADFILSRLYDSGVLLHSYKDGIAKLQGYLDDHAFFIDALLDLYEASAKTKYLSEGVALATHLAESFQDDQGGGFYYTSIQHERLIERTRPVFDQSIPSGNAVSARIFLRLFYLTGRRAYYEIAEKTLKTFIGRMEDMPAGCGNLIASADFYLRRPKEIRVVGECDTPEMEAVLSPIHTLFLPNKVISFNETGPKIGSGGDALKMIDGKPTVYLCQDFSCFQPMTDLDEIRSSLLE